MRRLLIAVLVLVAVLAGAGTAAVLRGSSLLIPRLQAALSRASGHPASVGGVGIGWANGPAIRISDLALANPAGTTRPDLLRVRRVTALLDLSALLRGALRITAIHLDGPDLLLETDAAGRGNWQSGAPPAAPAAPAQAALSPAPPGPSLAIGTITIAGGHVAFREGRTGAVYQADLDGHAEPADLVHVDLTLHDGASTARIEGMVDPRAPLARSSLSLTGQVAIPEPIDVAAKITPGQAGQAVSAQAHGAGVEASASGVLDPATLRPVGPVTLEATMADGAALPARLGMAALPGPVRLHVLLRQQDEAVTLRDLLLTLPAGDIEGALDVTMTKPPSLRGSLRSRRLDLARLLADLSRPAAPAAGAPAAPAAPPSVPVPVRLPLQWLDRGNLDLRLAMAELHDGGITLTDLSGHLVVQDGRLVLDPFGGTGPGGRATLSLRADARAAPPAVALALHAPALALQPFVVLAGLQGNVGGTAAIDADLHATGATRPELLASLAGRASVVMGDGEIDLHLLADVLAAARLPIDPRGRAHVRCLVVRADLARGVASLSPLLVDATTVMVQGAGTVDLVQRSLALRLRPLLRTGPGLVVPIVVSGPWTKPKLDLDRGDLAGTLSGLIAPGGDACRAAGVASTAPLPAAKPLKPADLLRSLLR